MGELRDRVERVRQAVAGRPRPRALALEWSDPPFSGGHWVPDMIDAAGGQPLLAAPGDRSIRLAWPDIERADAEVVLFMPCGYDLDAAATEGRALTSRPELDSAARVWALPGNDCFSRPGPRVVDGVALLGSLLHPDLVAAPDTTRAIALR
jgi:iron complex transport system substrate-binding protein